MFRQHSWEAGSSWACEGALRFLLSADPVAVKMRRTAVFKIFPLCDPDGVARGGVRFNAHGFDLNRNWDAVDERITVHPKLGRQPTPEDRLQFGADLARAMWKTVTQ